MYYDVITIIASFISKDNITSNLISKDWYNAISKFNNIKYNYLSSYNCINEYSINYILKYKLNLNNKFHLEQIKYIIKKACLKNHLTIIIIITRNTEIFNNYALYQAYIACNLLIIKYLIENINEIDINIHKSIGLRIACEKGKSDIVKYLLTFNKIDIFAENNCAVRSALKNNHVKIAKLLLDRGAVINAANNDALVGACEKGATNAVKFIISYYDDINKEIGVVTALRHACINGRLPIAKILIEKGVPVNLNDNEIIRMSCLFKKIKIVKYLLSLDDTYGINISANNNFALKFTCYFRYEKMVKFLLSLPKKYNIDKKIVKKKYPQYIKYIKHN